MLVFIFQFGTTVRGNVVIEAASLGEAEDTLRRTFLHQPEIPKSYTLTCYQKENPECSSEP